MCTSNTVWRLREFIIKIIMGRTDDGKDKSRKLYLKGTRIKRQCIMQQILSKQSPKQTAASGETQSGDSAS